MSSRWDFCTRQSVLSLIVTVQRRVVPRRYAAGSVSQGFLRQKAKEQYDNLSCFKTYVGQRQSLTAATMMIMTLFLMPKKCTSSCKQSDSLTKPSAQKPKRPTVQKKGAAYRLPVVDVCLASKGKGKTRAKAGSKSDKVLTEEEQQEKKLVSRSVCRCHVLLTDCLCSLQHSLRRARMLSTEPLDMTMDTSVDGMCSLPKG